MHRESFVGELVAAYFGQGRTVAMDNPPPALATILLSCPKCFEGKLQLISLEPDPTVDMTGGVLQVFYGCRRCNFTNLRRWRPGRR
jgi:hypothetical protein